MRWYLRYRQGKVHKVDCTVDLVSAGRPGHGLVHLLVESAQENGLAWDSAEEG